MKLQLQSPFPIPLNGAQEWPVYTAHLTDLGSCIIEPDEIHAVHSMGFFGKGSLSRSAPSFGKARYGAPPVIKNRQWLLRQEWLKEVKELNSASSSNFEVEICDAIAESRASGQCGEGNASRNRDESIGDVIEVSPGAIDSGSRQREEIATREIDEVVLDSAEEDDVCVIVNKDSDDVEDSPRSIQDDQDSSEEQRNNERPDVGELVFHEYRNDVHVNENDELHGKLLVLPDSDSDTENYLKNIKPRIEKEGFPIREALHLTFEETFFLLFALGCLQVIHFDGSLLDINGAWLYFCKERPDFLQKYVVYHYYRSRGWVVKPGFKYGGDFLLYKHGPPFYHASYIVIVEVADADSLVRSSSVSTRSIMTWDSLFGLDRLSETAAKEILFAQVLWPSSVARDLSATSPEVLSEFTVRELLWRRWNPRQHREDGLPTEEEDEDSC